MILYNDFIQWFYTMILYNDFIFLLKNIYNNYNVF